MFRLIDETIRSVRKIASDCGPTSWTRWAWRAIGWQARDFQLRTGSGAM